MDEIPRINAPHSFKMHPTFGNDRCIYGLSKDRGGVSCGRPLDDPIHTGLFSARLNPSEPSWTGPLRGEQAATLGKEIKSHGVMSPLEAVAELRRLIESVTTLRHVAAPMFDLIERELRR